MAAIFLQKNRSKRARNGRFSELKRISKKKNGVKISHVLSKIDGTIMFTTRNILLFCRTEALAESFYRVFEKQVMEGKQSLDVLALRSKIDWCLPPVLQCDVALTEMAHLYIEGDKKCGLKKHYVPVYRDKRSVKNRFTDCSKVVGRIKKTPAKISLSNITFKLQSAIEKHS